MDIVPSTTNTNREIRPKRTASRRGLLIASGIIGAFFFIELLAGIFTHSLALVADALHLLSDVAAMGLALLAIWFASRPATKGHTYGYYRVEILAALANGITLWAVAGYVLFEAYRRFISPPEILSLPMLLVAIVGLVAESITAMFMKRSAGESLNARAVYVHVMTDAVQSAGLVVAGIVMLLFKWFVADPIVSVIIALFMFSTGWRIVGAAVGVLLESSPVHVNIERLRQRMLQVEGVVNVHDIHAWSITTGYEVLSAHVVMLNPRQVDRNTLLNRLRDVARSEFRIAHVTIQLEENTARCEETHQQ